MKNLKIMLFVGPAAGIVNHTIALAKVLQNMGYIPLIVTAPSVRKHIEMLNIDCQIDIIYSPSHEINFNKLDADRIPHLQQICSYNNLINCINAELELFVQHNPYICITKHHYSIAVSAPKYGIPYITFYTDGAEYLIDNRNPQSVSSTPDLINNYHKAFANFFDGKKEGRNIRHIVDVIRSPNANIIRGVPCLSSLSDEEKQNLPKNCMFGGILTYDGESTESDEINDVLFRFKTNDKIIYVTFGTLCYDFTRYLKIMEYARNLPFIFVISTMHFSIPQSYEVPKNVFLFKYIPNHLILKHCYLIIHHGGHGTALSSFLYGVPQIVIPDNIKSSAQAIHAEKIEKLGVGINLSNTDFNYKNLANLLKTEQVAEWKIKAQKLLDQIMHEEKLCNQNINQMLSSVTK